MHSTHVVRQAAIVVSTPRAAQLKRRRRTCTLVRRIHEYASARSAMGRRQRQRTKPRQAPRPDPAREPSGTRMARVAVSEEVWTEFRHAIGTRSIAEALGDLVEREVARSRSRRVRDSELEPRDCSKRLIERISSRTISRRLPRGLRHSSERTVRPANSRRPILRRRLATEGTSLSGLTGRPLRPIPGLPASAIRGWRSTPHGGG